MKSQTEHERLTRERLSLFFVQILHKHLYGQPAVHVYLHRADHTYLDINISIGSDWHEIPWDDTQYQTIVCSVLYDPNDPNQIEFQIEWCFDPVV